MNSKTNIMKTRVRIGKDQVYAIKKSCDDLELNWEVVEIDHLGDAILLVEHEYPHQLFYLGRQSRVMEQIWELENKSW